MFDFNTLVASLIWGTIGTGLVAYGKSQTRAPAIIGGLGLIVVSFIVTAPLILSLVAIAIVGGSWFAMRQGY